MFVDHQPIIARYGRANPDHFARVLTFVIASVRARLGNLTADMQVIEDHGGEGVLYGWKHAAVFGISERRIELWETCEEHAARADPDALPDALVATLVTVHGFGYPKAGFAAQLLYGVSGCLDTHNVRRFELRARAPCLRERDPRATAGLTRKHVAQYNALILRCGGTAVLWDTWCAYVAARAPDTWKTANHASAEHCVALGLPTKERMK